MIKYLFPLLALLPLLVSCQSAATSTQTDLTAMTDTKDFAKVFAADFAKYKMDIQAAGMASLPVATLKNGELYIEYAYVSGAETRNGKMTLTKSAGRRYDGTWRTQADNGNVYSGSLHFIFTEDGSAAGTYQFSGTDYQISILKK